MVELLSRAWKATREKGVGHVVRSGIDILSHRVKTGSGYWYHRLFRSSKTFIFQGDKYHYFFHKFNTTWRNERCVEIPIIWEIVGSFQSRNVLEVGNVLSHYYPIKHDVIDKYEIFDGVINQDVVDFIPSKRYDLIVSISTMEHVGWDEDPRNQSKILREPVKILNALDHLKECLAPGGNMVITFPVGYNPQLDKSLAEGRIEFTKRVCMRRLSRNGWAEADWDACREARYGVPYTAANALVVLFISKR